MAKRIFATMAATSGSGTADNATVGTSGFMAIKGGSSTQLIDIFEILVSGFATSSAPALGVWARMSTLETTPTTLATPGSDGPMHPSTAALAAAPVTFIAAATGPTRSNAASDGRINLGLNLFGGIIRWQAAPTQQFSQLGNTAQLGESGLSFFTGTTSGSYSAHVIYEPY